MALLDLQTVLARLYTDSAFRARFFHSPGEACHGIVLTAAEKQQLAALDRRQVERFARSLKQKRLGLVRELLPGAAAMMADRFNEQFFHYCDEQPRALERVAEAVTFAHYLQAPERADTLDQTLPAYWGDLIQSERLRLKVLFPPAVSGDEELAPSAVDGHPTLEDLPGARPRLAPHARVAAFQYDLEALYPQILRGELIEAQPDPCFILIAKVPGALRVKMKRVNAATAQLLTRCDGTRTLETIVDEVATALRLNAADRHELARECHRFLAPLVENDLIRLLD